MLLSDGCGNFILKDFRSCLNFILKRWFVKLSATLRVEKPLKVFSSQDTFLAFR